MADIITTRDNLKQIIYDTFGNYLSDGAIDAMVWLIDYNFLNSPDFGSLTEYSVPYVEGGTLVSSEVRVDPVTKAWTFANKIEVPGGSIDIGEVITLSEGTGDLLVKENIEGKIGCVVLCSFTDAGSAAPEVFYLDAVQTIVIQSDFSETITDNPLTVPLTAAENRQANAVTFKTGAVMNNARFKITHVASGVVIQYFPSKFIWEQGTGGYNMTKVGDNTFNFLLDLPDDPANGLFYIPSTPFRFIQGDDYEIQIIADSVDMLGNSSGVPYLTADVQDGVDKPLSLKEESDRHQTTGLLEGGVISQASGTTVDWTSGRGIVTNYADPENPVITDATWDAVTGYTPTNLATDGTTLFGYNSSGVLQEKLSTAVAIEDVHNIIWFGSITHLSSTVVSVITSPGNMGYDGIGSFSDFINLVIGPANVDGNVYDANGTNVNIDVSGGNAYMIGSNFRINPKLSDIVTLPTDTTVSFQKVYKSAGAGLSIIYDGVPTTTIDPSQYDDGSGTLQTTTAGYWTIQRIFRGRTGGTFVAYGQEQFATKGDAIAVLGKEAFIEKSPLPFTLYRCSLLVVQGATDLSDTDEAEFHVQTSFRISGVQSSTASIPGVTSPGGVDSNIQYNDSNTFGGSAKFCYFDTTDVTNVSIHSGSLTGQANLIFRDNGAGNKGYIRYDQTSDSMRHITLSGIDIEFAPGAGANVGVNIGDPVSCFHIYENNANTGANTGLTIEQDSTGDAIVQFYLTGGQRWVAGIDNSDEDKWKLAANVDVGTNPIITATTDRYVGINKDTPGSPLVVYEDTTTSDSSTGVVIEQDGTGNALLQLLTTGIKRWVIGLDNTGVAASSDLVIGDNADLSDASRAITINPDSQVAIGMFPAAQSMAKCLTVYFDHATTASNILIQQAGTGDAALEWLIPGRRWTAGIDNSDSDKWMLSPSNGLADAILTVTTDGKIGGNILAPTSGFHLYENDAATDDTTGIKIEQDGAGDAALHFLITGGDNWSMGIDQSDAERFKLAPNTDVGSSSALDISSTDINFLSARTNLANSSTTTFLTMNSPTATGLTALLFKDNLASLHGSLSYNFNVDQLQINSVFGDIVLFAGSGLLEIDSGSATQNYIRMATSGASSTTGLQVQNSSIIDLEMVYDQSADKSYIVNRSANGLEIESTDGPVRVKTTDDDIIFDMTANTGRIEIVGLAHTDSHPILNIATSDGDTDFYVGEDTPVGNVSAVGGAIYFRDDELDSGIFVKRSSGAASTTGWEELGIGDVSGTNTTANSIAAFDTTSSDTIVGMDDALVVQSATDTQIRLNPATAAGHAGILFYDNAKVGITADIRWHETSGDLILQNIGGRIEQSAAGDFDILMSGGNHTFTIDSATGTDTTQLMTLDTGGTNGGVADIYMTGRSPAANISALGGSFAFRDQEANSGFYIKKTAGAASTSGWQPVISSTDLNVVDNALVTFDGTTGTNAQQCSGVTAITTATEAEIVLTSQGATGGCAIEFYDNTPAIKFSIIHNDNTNENHIVSDEELTIQVIGSNLSILSGDDIFIKAASGANIVAINDDFIFSDITTDAIFSIECPGVTAEAAIEIKNASSATRLKMGYDQNLGIATISVHNEVPLLILGSDQDDDDILLSLDSDGTNGAHVDIYVGDRTPIGNVTANPGSEYKRVDGINSDVYTHKGSGTDSATWNRNVTVNPDEGIEFVPTTGVTNIEGQVFYDSVDRSLSVSQGDGVTANLAKETFVPPRVRNDQGSIIYNAEAVYISGSDGTYPDVKYAKADAASTAGVIGLITQDEVAIGALGWCTTYGLVRDFDTQTPGWSAGDVLYLSATTAGALTNVAPTYPNFVTRVGTVIAVGTTDGSIFVNHPSKEDVSGSTPVTKSYSVGDYGSENVNYSAGFYEYDVDETVLTIGGTVSEVFGDANRALNAHAFVVIGSTTTSGCTLTVHGTSITSAGVRTTGDNEVIIADTDGVSVNEYYETSKKWLGNVTYTLTGTSGALDFNFGVAKYEDFGNSDFTVTEFEAVGKASGNDSDVDIILWHHSDAGWTYNAGAFKPEPTKICSMGDNYSTDDNIDTGKYFSYKRTGLDTTVIGSAMEGVLIEFDITTNNSLWYANFHIGVLL